MGIWKNNIRTEFSIHRLVAKVFIPNPDNLPQVKHKDENRENNHFDNLEWVSRSGNMNKTKIYLMMDPRGSRVEIQDMTEFCKNNPGLNRHHMLSIHSERKNRHGNMIKYHKGWSKWYDQ